MSDNGGAKLGYPHDVPISFVQVHMDDDLLAGIQREFAHTELELAGDGSGFAKAVDYPQLPEHSYYEGYFHTQVGAETGGVGKMLKRYFLGQSTEERLAGVSIPSMNPRLGVQMDKPPCAPFLRAFAEAFRRKNVGGFLRLGESLASIREELVATGDVPAYHIEALELFEKKATSGALFGDAAVQVHYGTGVTGGNLGYHVDACNSFVHMAISVRGKRRLFWRSSKGGDKYEANINAQEPGDVYISSPCLFIHGVEYPETDWSTRVCAIQLRILCTSQLELHKLGYIRQDTELLQRVASAVTNLINSDTLSLPSFGEVTDVYKCLYGVDYS